MAFEQGHKKQGGRTKGVPNKTTKEIRVLLTEVLEGEIERIKKFVTLKGFEPLTS